MLYRMQVWGSTQNGTTFAWTPSRLNLIFAKWRMWLETHVYGYYDCGTWVNLSFVDFVLCLFERKRYQRMCLR